jgi:hypothetical protein
MHLPTPTIAVPLMLAILLAAGCDKQETSRQEQEKKASDSRFARQTAQGEPQTTATTWRVGHPISYANLAIFPVQTSTPQNDDPYITLQEGLRSGEVQVFEIGGMTDSAHVTEDPFGGALPEVTGNSEASSEGNESIEDSDDADLQEYAQDDLSDAEVERVLVRNDADKPLYLMPGEIILGGQQDRCVAQEMVIQPGAEPELVDVYCVEPGRWSGRSAEELVFFAQSFEASNATESGDLSADQEEDLQSRFIASAGVLNKRGRLAVQSSKDQSAVWDEVQAANAASGNDIDSDSFTGNYADPEVIASLAPYCNELEERVSSRENVIGVVVAINGEIETADIFASTPLFRKLWPKLLQSYAFDAATNPTDGTDNVGQQSLAIADAEQFLHEIETAQTTEMRTANGLVLSSRNAEDQNGRPYVTSIIPVSDDGTVIGGLGGGGFGGAIHTSGLAQ